MENADNPNNIHEYDYATGEWKENFFSDETLADKQVFDELFNQKEDNEFDRITSYKWGNGLLILIIYLTSGQSYDTPFSLIEKDIPIEFAKYTQNDVVDIKRGEEYETWSRNVQRKQVGQSNICAVIIT